MGWDSSVDIVTCCGLAVKGLNSCRFSAWVSTGRGAGHSVNCTFTFALASRFNTHKNLRFTHKVPLCVSYLFRNKQHIFPYTASTLWFLEEDIYLLRGKNIYIYTCYILSINRLCPYPPRVCTPDSAPGLKPSLANIICAWIWRLCEINLVIYFYKCEYYAFLTFTVLSFFLNFTSKARIKTENSKWLWLHETWSYDWVTINVMVFWKVTPVN